MRKETIHTESRSKSLTEDWFTNHPEAKAVKALLSATAESKRLQQILWPTCEDYDNPLNAIFLLQIQKLEALNQRPLWLIRDGLIPLIWFFRTYPEPKNIKTKLLVDESLASFIPESWRMYFGTYRIDTKAEKSYDKIIIAGLMMEAYSSLKYLPSALSKITTELGSKALELPKLGFLMSRLGFASGPTEQIYSIKYSLEIFKTFGANLTPLNWQSLVAKDDYSNTLFIDLNEKQLVADNYLTHFFLERGAALFKPASQDANKESKYIPISIHHGAYIVDHLTKQSSLNDLNDDLAHYETLSNRIMSAMTSDANKKFPWPTWFADCTSNSARNLEKNN